MKAKDLYSLGFALHWLHHKSKRPIGREWTIGPRKSWEEFQKSYKPGMNIGVRLGQTSKLSNGFLAVIDCDIKSSDPKHLAELDAHLERLFPGLKCPTVRTGRGNGSRHLYVLTPKVCGTTHLFKSKDIVKCFMPSSENPSKSEKQTLTKEELKAGWRLRAAWEISLMGEGGQCVLPPSIHPDTGTRYEWLDWDFEAIPVINPDVKVKDLNLGTEIAPSQVIESVELDKLPPGLKFEIVEGIDTTEYPDESARLFKICILLDRAGFTEAQIASCLTDPLNAISEVAKRHTGNSERAAAMRWVLRYNVHTAKAANDHSDDFEVIDRGIQGEKGEFGKLIQVEESKDVWKAELDRAKEGGAPRPTFKNICLILENAIEGKPYKFDEFSCEIISNSDKPWGTKRDSLLKNIEELLVKKWLIDNWRLEAPREKIQEAIALIAEQNKFHPVKDYLGSLEWDNKDRLDSWLTNYLNAEGPEPYLRSIGRMFLTAAVYRIYEPGCKFDTSIILEGVQDIGKTKTIDALGGKWAGKLPTDLSNKDAILGLAGNWFVEMGEMSQLRKNEMEEVKSFLTRQVDKVRPHYGRVFESFPRQCVFMGTTNKDQYLQDDTGNRRFWTVKVGECKFKEIESIRDQLFAEAVFNYKMRDQIYITDPEIKKLERSEQAARFEEDILVEQLRNFLSDPNPNFHYELNRIPVTAAFEDQGPFPGLKNDLYSQRRVASAFRLCGYQSQVHKVDKKSRKFWAKKSRT